MEAQATWFCLADQAVRHPGLIRRIAQEGHRIALHGWTHRRAFEMDRSAFRESLRKGKGTLEDLLGAPVLGFRAPEWSFRHTAESFWEILAETGFWYDSSRAPLNGLGSHRWGRFPYQLAPGFWEIPPPVAGVGWLRIPLWSWPQRVLPVPLLRRALLSLAHRDAGTPVVLHPWELDVSQPPLKEAGLVHRFVHGAGLRGFSERLVRLLEGVTLEPLETWLARRTASLGQG